MKAGRRAGRRAEAKAERRRRRPEPKAKRRRGRSPREAGARPSRVAGRRAGLRVGVVGATGLVGTELLNVLRTRRFPVRTLTPFSSGRTRQKVRFGGRALNAATPTLSLLGRCDLVFFVSSDAVARRFAKPLARRGVWVIDDSSAFRLDPEVPLVIPEVNAGALSRNRRLIAGPNCTLTGLAVAGWPILKACGVRSVRMASYQSVSGAGKTALAELESQARAALRPGGLRRVAALKPKALPHPVAFNLFPQVGSFDRAGHSTEEVKVIGELRKIWEKPGLKISVTAVRVPVLRVHSLSVWLETRQAASPPRVLRLLEKAPGVRVLDGRGPASYATPLTASGRWPVFVGRVRKSGASPREIVLWITTDNLLKGAALNSVQIAEHLLLKGWLGGVEGGFRHVRPPSTPRT